MNTLSYLGQLPTTKSEIKEFVSLSIEQIKGGNVDPLEFIRNASAVEKMLKAIKADSDVKEQVILEAEKFGGKSFDHIGCKFQVKEAGTKYDFTGCNDSEWDNLTEQINKLTEARKEREAFLKTIKPDMEIADGNTGELLNAPFKTSTTTVAVTLK